MNCSFKHAYMAECLKGSTIISIPKDYRCSLIKSDNYSGICVCSGISKLFDITMFKNNGDKLSTSSLLFAYKPVLSTTFTLRFLPPGGITNSKGNISSKDNIVCSKLCNNNGFWKDLLLAWADLSYKENIIEVEADKTANMVQ